MPGYGPFTDRCHPLTEPVIPWQLGMIWRRDRYLSFAAREWIAFAMKVLGEL